MAVELNHTIVAASDKRVSAEFLAELLGLPAPQPFGPFLVVGTANGVSLDFMDTGAPVVSQHYAFLVDDDEFDVILGRIRAREMPHWADPGHQQPGEVNTNDGGRGVYFEDPDGHNLEIITVPYGG